jgi:hypothetical protein
MSDTSVLSNFVAEAQLLGSSVPFMTNNLKFILQTHTFWYLWHCRTHDLYHGTLFFWPHTSKCGHNIVTWSQKRQPLIGNGWVHTFMRQQMWTQYWKNCSKRTVLGLYSESHCAKNIRGFNLAVIKLTTFKWLSCGCRIRYVKIGMICFAKSVLTEDLYIVQKEGSSIMCYICDTYTWRKIKPLLVREDVT